ncbi:MAG: TonB family protein [Akkermansia sp.]
MSRRFERRTRDRAAQRRARLLLAARRRALAVLALLGLSAAVAARLPHPRGGAMSARDPLTALLPEAAAPLPHPTPATRPAPLPQRARATAPLLPPLPEADIRPGSAGAPAAELAAAELPPAPELPELPDLPPELELDAPPEPVPTKAHPRRTAVVRRTAPPADEAPPLRPPRYRHAPAPPPPDPPRAAQLRVRIAVSAQGEPTAVEILESSGHSELDRRTRAWVLAHWSFYPAQRADDSPAPSAVITRIIFEDAG